MVRGRTRGAVRAALGAALLAFVASCNTQRWPEPMTPMADPLPEGSASGRAGGVEDVLVVRHGDPVQVRRAGSTGAFPMRFFAKRERVTAGAWVYCGAGGKAEVLWPREGLSIVLWDECSVRIGERERGEPAADLMTVTRAQLTVLPGVTLRLPGGAIFEGDPDARSGPFVLTRLETEVLRLKNQSKGTASVRYRDQVLRLSPGQIVDLALLEVGSAPRELQSSPTRVDRGALVLNLDGRVAIASEEGGVTVQAEGDGSVAGSGVLVRLAPGDRARFAPLGQPAGSTLPSPAGTPPAQPSGAQP